MENKLKKVLSSLDTSELDELLDSELKTVDGYIGFHTNDNTAFLWLRFSDLIKFIKGRSERTSLFYCVGLLGVVY